MSIMAAVMSDLIPIRNWTNELMDVLLYSGHFLFKAVCERRFSGVAKHLLHTEVPQYVSFQSDLLTVKFDVSVRHHEVQYGVLFGSPVLVGSNVNNLNACIETVLLASSTALVTIASTTVCLIAQNDRFYLFDSHSRNSTGNIAANGLAVLLNFLRVDEVAAYFRNVYGIGNHNAQVEISPVDITIDDVWNVTSNETFLGMFCYPCISLVFDLETNAYNKNDNSLNCKRIALFREGSADIVAAKLSKPAKLTKCSISGSNQLPTMQANGCSSEVDVASAISQVVENVHSSKLRDDCASEVVANVAASVLSSKCSFDHRIEVILTEVLENAKRQQTENEACLETISDIIGSLAPSANKKTPRFFNNFCEETVKNIVKRKSDKFKLFTEFCSIGLKYACHSCSCILYANNINTLKIKNDITDLLDLCVGNSCLCNYCLKHIMVSSMPPRSSYNMLDTSFVPEIIQQLNIIEKRFVCQLQSYMTVILLPAGQQYAQRGLAVHFPSDVSDLLQQLPPPSTEDVPVLCTAGKTSDIVRPWLVFAALQYLKQHNTLYEHVELSNRGVVYGTDCSALVADLEETGAVTTDYVTPKIDMEQLLTTGRVIQFPRSTTSPITYNDFASAEPLAFPWLFPTGKNHRDSPRPVKLSLLKYYWTRLYNIDNRFRLDIPYILTSCNSFERTSLIENIEIQARVMKPFQDSNDRHIMLKAQDLQTLEPSSDVLHNSYMFMKKIRGTCAYWKDRLWDLLATIKALGPPDIFLTLSADDAWPDLARALQSDMPDVHNMTHAVRKDPLIVAWHFERRWNCFLKQFILAHDGPFGIVSDYWARIEFQNRGSPHVHAFFWVEGAPSLHKQNSTAEICRFIDSIISCNIPNINHDPELHRVVTRKHKHSHRPSCLRKKVCRYSFPRRACSRTRLTPNVDLSSRKHRFRFYELKRDCGCELINEHNPAIAKAWNANTDCQLVGSYVGAAYYACSYICKSEPQELREKLALALEEIRDSQCTSSRVKLFKIGITVLKSRQMSAVEACFRLGNLKLTFSSREVVFLAVGLPQNRMKLLKPRREWIQKPGHSTDIFKNSFIDHYTNRPVELELVTLYSFAATYRVDYSKTTPVRGNPRIRLLDGKTVMVKRGRPACIRTIHHKEGSEDYYYALLQLHVPHRDECQLIHPFSCSSESFYNKSAFICAANIQSEAVYNELMRSMARITLCQRDLQYNVEPESGSFNNKEGELAALDDLSVSNITDTYQSGLDVAGLSDSEEGLWHTCVLGIHEVEKTYNALTTDQKRVVNYIKQEMSANRLYYVFITGNAGTGKSFLFKFLVQYLQSMSASISGLSPVLVCAPTGMAARNVAGSTIHSALKIPVQHGYERSYYELSTQTLQTLRRKLMSVHTIFIDEISMVSASLLESVHRRLCSIKQCEDPFGGLSVVLAGDFFQLRPVRGRFAFTHECLWSLFLPMFLDQNVRQCQDSIYASLLSRVKIGALNDSDRCLLKQRLFLPPGQENKTRLRMYPTRKLVSLFNSEQQSKIASDAHVLPAETYFSAHDLKPDQVADSAFVPEDDRVAGGLCAELTISVGTRVMLLKNLCQEEGLVNGAMGYVESVQFTSGAEKLVYVKFDDRSVGRIFCSADHHNAIPIEPVTVEYIYKGRHLLRRQFPLCPAWAVTIHKSQGLSVSSAIMSLGKELFCAGQAYVALSRVTTLEGLYIEKIDFNRIFCDDQVLEQNHAMRLKYEELKKIQYFSSALFWLGSVHLNVCEI